MPTKKRAVFVLFAATASTVAIADPVAATQRPTPTPSQPRTLPTGQPACGNVMFKSVEPPVCTVTRAILAGVFQDLQEIREHVALFDRHVETRTSSLTLAVKDRPRS